MTLHFLNWAFNAPVDTPEELAVLLVAASMADQDGDLIISRQKLAEKVKMRADKIDQVIDNLCENGLISVFDARDWNKLGICLKAGE